MAMGPYIKLREASAAHTGAKTGTDLVAAVTGMKIVVTRLEVDVIGGTTTVSVFFGTDASGNRVVYGSYPDGGGVIVEPPPQTELSGASGAALKITTSANNARTIVHYYLQPVQ